MRVSVLLGVMVADMAIAGGSSAAEFYVSLTGNDRWAGTVRQPYATLERARDAVRV